MAGISWIGVIFDALDGYVARKRKVATQFGAFFDSTMDRIADFFYVTAFAFAGLISWPMVSVVLLSSFLISYTKARGESLLPKEIHIKEGIMQRTERLVVLFVVYVVCTLGWSQVGVVIFFLLFFLNSITCVQRIFVIKQILVRYSEVKRS